MAEKIKKRVINLIPNKNEGIFAQFLTWSLTVGRLLIIITETLALSVFLFRFILDVQIIDLHDKIKQESIIVENFKQAEDDFRNLQMRIALAKAYDSKKNVSLSLLQNVIDMGKNKVTFLSVTVKNSSMSIEAQSTSATALNSFVKSLKALDEIREISIDRVETSPSSGKVLVAISISLKNNIQTTDIPTDEENLEEEKQ